ncbi:hypothetical protein J2X57_001342 [Luteibacter sp. 1214]|nr:hypothetical protein [Luteibacter sp. 1214]
MSSERASMPGGGRPSAERAKRVASSTASVPSVSSLRRTMASSRMIAASRVASAATRVTGAVPGASSTDCRQ